MYPGLDLVGPTKTNLIGLEKFCPNNFKLRPFKPLMQLSLSEKRLLAPISYRDNFVKRTSRPSSCKLRLTLVQFDLRWLDPVLYGDDTFPV